MVLQAVDPLARIDVATAIAWEHIAWARRQGLTPRQIRAAVGAAWLRKPTWNDAVRAVLAAWLLKCADREHSSPLSDG